MLIVSFRSARKRIDFTFCHKNIRYATLYWYFQFSRKLNMCNFFFFWRKRARHHIMHSNKIKPFLENKTKSSTSELTWRVLGVYCTADNNGKKVYAVTVQSFYGRQKGKSVTRKKVKKKKSFHRLFIYFSPS